MRVVLISTHITLSLYLPRTKISQNLPGRVRPDTKLLRYCIISLRCYELIFFFVQNDLFSFFLSKEFAILSLVASVC